MKVKDDVFFMRAALRECQKAVNSGEVPVGAVIVKDGKIIARGFNKNITATDPTAHAEIVALRRAAKKLGNYRLNDCTIYVTLEPCAMCASALVHARIKKIVYGAPDPKAGACGSIFNIARHEKLNHKIELSSGALEDECSKMLKDFFKSKRQK
ncbi:MAG: tRNA adenosine(34) deaminase TadA [Elusimicrobia bacterium]|nr:tRNA adenosine(34) deaminase TadA [Elusimicrobiota bacterium]